MSKVLAMEVERETAGDEIQLQNVSWSTYEAILRGLGERHVRVTYDQGDVGIMTVSFEHESSGTLLGRLVDMLTFSLDIPIASGGMTTLRKKWRQKGLESDKSYWIQNEQRMRGKKQWLARRDPPPDLVIEIEISRSVLNRMGIYAALGVPEIWTFDGQRLTIFHLDSTKEEYRECSHGRAFAFLAAEEIQHFLDQIRSVNETAWIRAFAKWVNSELAPRFQLAQAQRKNDKSKRRQ